MAKSNEIASFVSRTIDNNHTFLCIKEQDDASVTENNSNLAIKEIKNIKNISEVYIIYHGTHPKRQINPNEIASDIKLKYAAKFRHGDNDLYPVIRNFIANVIDEKDNIILEFDELCDLVKKKSDKFLVVCILHNFLPLDIEMQTLKELLNDEKKKESITYLKEILTDIEDSFFINKLIDIKKEIIGITDVNYRKELDALLNEPEISNLLTMLDTLTQWNKQKKEDLTENLLQDTQCLNVVTLFHDWYCKFTERTESFSAKTTNRKPGTAV